MTITLQTVVLRELEPFEADENIRDLDVRTAFGWRDLTSGLTGKGVPGANQPQELAFGPSGIRTNPAFAIDDYMHAQPFHVNHDVKVGGKTLLHVHWSTGGTDTNPVRWEFQVSQAKGHDQEFFGASVSYFLEIAPNQTSPGAWRHYVSELPDIDALIGLEPDTLVFVTLRRVTNGATDNVDDVFGLTVDFHYEADRHATPNKVPNFYA